MSSHHTFTRQTMPPQLHGNNDDDDEDVPPRPKLEEYNQARSVQDLLPTIQHLLPSERLK